MNSASRWRDSDVPGAPKSRASRKSGEQYPAQAIMAVPGSIEVKFSGRSRLPAAIGGLVAALAVFTLSIAWPRSTISRQDAVRAALHAPWNQQLPTDLVTGMMLIHRSDLRNVMAQDGA